MKSIRLSLIVYFVLLLAVALGAVSWLSYESTGQALAAKEASSTKLREAQYGEERVKVKERFDKDILSRARTLEARASFYSHQLDIPVTIGMALANLPYTAHLQFSIWDHAGPEPSFRPNPNAQARYRASRPFDVRLFLHDEDHGVQEDIPMDEGSLVERGEYYQLSTWRAGRILDRSQTLGDASFKQDDELRKKLNPQGADGYCNDYELRPGHMIRRVTLLI